MQTMSGWDRAYLRTPEEWARLLAAFTHELRTPIASFGMLAELLAGAPPSRLGEQERRYCESMREVAREIQLLVGDMAELSRLLGGRVSLRLEDATLETLADQVEERVRTRAWERGVAIERLTEPAPRQGFRADTERLRRLLTLVLDVAVGQAQAAVIFQLALTEAELRAAISSDGEPFPEGAQDLLLVPFGEPLQSPRPRGGRSLALPLASELARAMGGTLRAGNRGGRPCFDLAMPAPVSDADPGR